jgi:hypothetical protein
MTPNQPNSNLGGTDIGGQSLSAQVHAEVATIGPDGTPTMTGKSASMAVNCHQGP